MKIGFRIRSVSIPDHPERIRREPAAWDALETKGNGEHRSDGDDPDSIESLRRKYDRYEDWIMTDDFAIAATRLFTEAKSNALSGHVGSPAPSLRQQAPVGDMSDVPDRQGPDLEPRLGYADLVDYCCDKWSRQDDVYPKSRWARSLDNLRGLPHASIGSWSLTIRIARQEARSFWRLQEDVETSPFTIPW